eukprot:gb/GECG01015061.1/.p1 GENE.gb/GECG01015061.1/~~gb/GECG01015061.1/.p1  ORF type:complete len:246 (+),score=16.96 gb/GECG01015061.1/:1-738(+)
MGTIQPVVARIPYHVCPGNHEQHGAFAQYQQRFTMPMMGRNSSNMWHSFNLGNVHYAVINSEAWFGHGDLESQFEWLSDDLEQANELSIRTQRPFIAVVSHRPMYCSSRGHSECRRKDNPIRVGKSEKYQLEELLNRYNVDFYFTGHVHAYARSFPLYNYTYDVTGNSSTLKNVVKPIHFTVGGAGNKEGKKTWKSKDPWFAFQSNAYGIGNLETISRDTVRWTYRDADTWSVVDEITVVNSRYA